MTPEKVLEHPAKVLSNDQRRFYFEHGYLHLDGFVSDDWLDRLWAVTLIASVLAVGAYMLVKAVEKYLFRWQVEDLT